MAKESVEYLIKVTIKTYLITAIIGRVGISMQ